MNNSVLSSALIIPLVPENEIIAFLENILGEIPRLEWVRNNASFTITHYKIEGLLVNENEPLHKEKQIALLDATEKAQRWFPHNTPNFDDLYHENDLPGPYMRGGYCKIKISLYYDDVNDRYILERKRLSGDSFSASYLFGIFGYELNTNILWMTRKPYVSLVEGVQIAAGKEDHISKYLFNELIGKEVCSYISEDILFYKSLQSSFVFS